MGFGALQRLFARPTLHEYAAGLRFVAFKATGFKNLRIADGVARVQLTGGCSSGGSTFTEANEIMPTLKQFPSVHWVKIYSPSGRTERPRGYTDSIPACLKHERPRASRPSGRAATPAQSPQSRAQERRPDRQPRCDVGPAG